MYGESPYRDYTDAQLDEVEYEDLYNSLDGKKRVFFATLIKTFGNVTQTCDITHTSRSCFYFRWMKQDSVFRYLVNSADFEDRMIDFAESKLMKKIEEGDTIATIFFLKTRGKKRGYVEKAEVKHTLNLDEKPTWFDAPQALPPSQAYPEIEDAEVVDITTKKDGNAT